MSYKTILACLTSVFAAERILPTVTRLAVRFDAHLIGLHTLEAIVPYPGIAMHVDHPYFDAFNEEISREDKAIETLFLELAERNGVTAEWRSLPTRSVSASDEILKSAFRSDIAAVLPPDREHERVDQFGIQRDLIVNSGAPVLLVPPEWGDRTVGTRVVMAWNATREAALAMRGALPMMRTADQVSILTIAASRRHSVWDDSEGHEIARVLSRHGIEPDVVHISQRGEDVGARIISEAEKLDADLLVMGAYGHSRLHRYIFGDASGHVLRHANLPVLFAR